MQKDQICVDDTNVTVTVSFNSQLYSMLSALEKAIIMLKMKAKAYRGQDNEHRAT